MIPFPFRTLMLISCILVSVSATGSPALPIHAGNLLVRPESLNELMTQLIAKELKGRLTDENLTFVLPQIRDTVTLPEENSTLKEILTSLSVRPNWGVSISPISTKLSFPADSLTVAITHLKQNQFKVTAHWAITGIRAGTSDAEIVVPPGLFKNSITIQSKNVSIGLARASAPIQLNLVALATLEPDGLKISITSLNTNLSDQNAPQFSLTLGPLTVDREPFALRLESDGEVMSIHEPEFRSALQTLEPQFSDLLRQSIASALQEQVTLVSQELSALPHLRMEMNTDNILKNFILTPPIQRLFGGMQFSFLFSSLQEYTAQNVYSGGISSAVELDQQCILPQLHERALGIPDLGQLKPQDQAGLLIEESYLQNIIQSEPFQRRFFDFYQSQLAEPGVNLAPAGVRFYLDPLHDGFTVVLNLEIEIGQTTASSPFSRDLNRFAEWIEQQFGSGKIVKIPVALTYRIQNQGHTPSGQPVIKLQLNLPFTQDGKWIADKRCALSDCPNNLSRMTPFIRNLFVADLKNHLASTIPAQINLPLGNPIKYGDYTAFPNQLHVTPENGLLIGASIRYTPEVRP